MEIKELYFYNQRFKNISYLKTPVEIPGRHSSYHLYVLRIDFDGLKISRSEVMRFFKKNGVGTQVHYIPIPYQPYYQKRFGFKRGDFPVCETYYREALSIPNYPAMSLADAEKVARLVERVVLRKGI